MASLPRVRQIEEDLRKAQLDPRLINVVCMMAERQRVSTSADTGTCTELQPDAGLGKSTHSQAGRA